MLKTETIFDACTAITPDFAAQLANCASQYASEVYLEHNDARFCVDSLIGILAMDLRKGMKVTVSAEGTDEAQAMQGVCALLRG